MIDGIAEKNILGTNDMAGPAYSLHNIERIEIIWGEKFFLQKNCSNAQRIHRSFE